MSEPWSKSLVRSAFSESLVDDAISEASGKILTEIEAELRTEIEDKSGVSNLKKALTKLKKLISEETYEALNEELAEIREDFTWAKSKREKYVSEIQDWAQSFFDEMRSNPKFDDLYVGGHASLEVVYIVGKTDSEATLNELIAFLNSKNPPRKIMTNVTITEVS